ncbi:MAG: AAA family ATPase [Terrabacter sp.]
MSDPSDVGRDLPNTPVQHGPALTAPIRPVVTLAAFHGAGGHVVGPRVADGLGVPFLDRGILTGVAERLHVPEQAVEQRDAESEKAPRSALRRYFDSLGRASIAGSTPGSDAQRDAGRYRAEIEEFLAGAAVQGGVVLGRGGAVVLSRTPGSLHVMLAGPVDARVRRVMQAEGLPRRDAERRVLANDRLRIEYVRDSYGVDPEDPDLYHLWIDSTSLDVDTCVELIVAAVRARHRAATDGLLTGPDHE